MRNLRERGARSWAPALAILLAACGGGGGASDTPGGGPVGDGNDSPATAATLPLDTPTSGAIVAADLDYFRFTTSGAGVVTVLITGLSADVDMTLYDATLSIVGSSVNAGPADDWVTFTAPAAGTFYVKLSGHLGATSPYLVTASVAPDDGDGSFAAATPIATGSVVIGSVATPGDRDYFRVTVRSGTLTLGLAGATADLDLELYDASEALIATSSNAGTAAESISTSVAAGVYYAVVSGAAGGTSPYTLQAGFVDAAANHQE